MLDVKANSSASLPHTLHWAHAAVLVAKLQFGLGILGIPSTFHTLGLVPGLLSLLAWSAVVLYAGLQLVPLRARHPRLADVGDLAGVLFCHNRFGVALVSIAYWSFLVLIVGAGLLTTSMALNAITDHATCTLVFVGAAAAVTLVVGAPLHQLHRVSWLGWIGLACIMASVWTLVVALLVVGRPYHVTASLPIQRPVVGRASLADSANAISVQVSCLMGNVAFYAVCAEMREPHLFKRALIAGQAFVMLHYIVVSVAVSAVAGQYIRSPVLRTAGPTVERICFAIALPGLLVSTLLYANMAAKYVYQRIVARSNAAVDWSPAQRWLVWTTMYAGVVLLGMLSAVAIPIFDQMLGLIGAALGPLFLLVITGLTGLHLLSKPDSTSTHWLSSTWQTMRTSKTAAYVGVLHMAMVLLGIALTVIGVYASMTLIVQDYTTHRSHGIPFSCANNLPS